MQRSLGVAAHLFGLSSFDMHFQTRPLILVLQLERDSVVSELKNSCNEDLTTPRTLCHPLAMAHSSNSYLRGNVKEEIKQTTHPRFKFLGLLLLAAALTYSLILQSLLELSTFVEFMGWIYCFA